MKTEKLLFSKKTYQGMPLHFTAYKKDVLFYVRDISNITGENILDFLSRGSVLETRNNENRKVQVVNFPNLLCYAEMSKRTKAKDLMVWIKDNIKSCHEVFSKKTEDIKETVEATDDEEYSQEKTTEHTWDEKKQEIDILLFLLKKRRTLSSEARRRIVFRLYEVVMGERYPG